MVERRDLLLGGFGLWLGAGPGPALAADLKDQPPLPPPLPRLRGLPLADEQGRATTLGALLGAPRPAVVSFWAVWCAPCALEGRELAKLRRKHADEQLAMLGINVDAAPDPVKLTAFRAKAQMNYRQALDGKRAYAALAGQEAVALPRTYVFDAAGAPVAAFGRYFGARTLRAINAAVARAVAT